MERRAPKWKKNGLPLFSIRIPLDLNPTRMTSLSPHSLLRSSTSSSSRASSAGRLMLDRSKKGSSTRTSSRAEFDWLDRSAVIQFTAPPTPLPQQQQQLDVWPNRPFSSQIAHFPLSWNNFNDHPTEYSIPDPGVFLLSHTKASTCVIRCLDLTRQLQNWPVNFTYLPRCPSRGSSDR